MTSLRRLLLTVVVFQVLAVEQPLACPALYCPLPATPNFAREWYDIYAVDGSDGCPQAGILWLFAGASHPVTVRSGPLVHLMRPLVLTLRSFSSPTDYMVGSFHHETGPCVDDVPTYNTNELDVPDVEQLLDGARPVGVRFTWELRGRDDLDVVLTALTTGASYEDASVRVSVVVTNRGGSTVAVGSRWSSEADSSVSFGVRDAFVTWDTPDPALEPYLDLEQQVSPPPGAFVVLTPGQTPSLALARHAFSFTKVSWDGACAGSGLSAPPEIVQYAQKGVTGDEGAWWHAFDWDIPGTPRPTSGEGPVISFFWGRTPATATTLAPGESVEWALNYVSWPVNEPQAAALTPSWTLGEPLIAECAGGETAVTVSVLTAGLSSTAVEWVSDSPNVTFDSPNALTTVARVRGLGPHGIEARGNAGAFCSRLTGIIEVRDTTPPVLDVPPRLLLRTSDGTGCEVAGRINASVLDGCAGSAVVVTNDITGGGATVEAMFPLNDTLVTFTATDPSGNVTTSQTLVTVIDDIAPAVIAASATPSNLWPPNHRMTPVHVALSAIDDCDPAPVVRLVAASSSQSDDGRGDGSTSSDIAGADLGTADFDVLVRAERSGKAGARIYALEYEVVDGAGNLTSVTVPVTVQHDRRSRVR